MERYLGVLNHNGSRMIDRQTRLKGIEGLRMVSERGRQVW